MINKITVVDSFWIKNHEKVENIGVFQKNIDNVLIKLENDFDFKYIEELSDVEKEFLLMSLCLHYFD